MSKLKYFVELEPGNHAYKEYVKTNNFYMTRKELGADHGKVIKVNGVNFGLHKIKAEPAKKNSLVEIVICISITWALLYFVPYLGSWNHPITAAEIPRWNWWGCTALAAILGILLGRLRMDFQKTDADFFNLSNV